MGNIFTSQKSHGMKRLVFNMVYRMGKTYKNSILPLFLRDVGKYYWNRKHAILEYQLPCEAETLAFRPAKCLMWALHNKYSRLIKYFGPPHPLGDTQLIYGDVQLGYEVFATKDGRPLYGNTMLPLMKPIYERLYPANP
jgi:hypothetical protein